MIWIILLIVIMIILIGIMIYDGNRFVVDNYSYIDERVAKETKFVFLTDLHNKEYGKDNEVLLNKVRELKPDLILVGGDMIVAKPHKDTQKTADFIGKLKEIAPICYGMGNHEYRSMIYPEVYADMYPVYKEQLSKYNIHILDNEYFDFNEFRIYGLSIERQFYIRFFNPPMPEGYVETLIGKADDSKVNILLAHNPDYFVNYADFGARLSLSGHIHGGVVRLPFVGGVFSPKLRLFPKYNGGEYKRKLGRLIVSRGLGVHTIPIRLFNPAEVSVITFKPVK